MTSSHEDEFRSLSSDHLFLTINYFPFSFFFFYNRNRFSSPATPESSSSSLISCQGLGAFFLLEMTHCRIMHAVHFPGQHLLAWHVLCINVNYRCRIYHACVCVSLSHCCRELANHFLVSVADPTKKLSPPMRRGGGESGAASIRFPRQLLLHGFQNLTESRASVHQPETSVLGKSMAPLEPR